MDLEEFQTGIGYQFENEDLLVQSLTHPSYMAEAHSHETNNQRLEFLGDSALALIITEYLYRTFPGIREGQLTQYRAALVKGSLLAKMAGKLKLSQYMRVSPNETGESAKDLPSSRKTLSRPSSAPYFWIVISQPRGRLCWPGMAIA